MSDSGPDRDSVTEVAEESFVRERPLEIERGAVLAGRYQVEEVIGKGGSGVVLRVFDRTVQNVVALKVLKSELARDAKWDKRFSRELRLGRPIQHPNVCRIFDIGEADGHRFLTMELAAGGSLRDELKRRPALDRPIEDRLADARAAIEGLAAIHATGVVHRDFKPDNLLRMEDGRLVISDFGLATDGANAPGVTVMIGTPHYMAPEVLAGEPATARSDVWALGVVLHEIFFGRRPERNTVSFDGSTKAPPRPETGIERAALALCKRCLADAPDQRPSDAREVSKCFADLTAPAVGPVRFRRRVAWVVASIAVAMLAVFSIARRQRKGSAVARSDGQRNAPVTGELSDWSHLSARVASFAGRVHCFTALDDHRVRVIWGFPRRADDLDVVTGSLTPAKLVPDAYAESCPDISAKTGRALYAARNAAGAMEVRLSERSDGRDAVVITSGRDPRWLGMHPDFLYKVDELHAAVFSLATMQFSLLPAGEDGRKFEIGDEAVSTTGDRLVITGYDDRAEARVEVFDRRSERQVQRSWVPVGSRVAFGWTDDQVLLVAPTFGPEQSLASLNVETGEIRRLGRLPGLDLTRVSTIGVRLGFVARHVSTDAWSYAGGKRKRLTAIGDVYSAALSAQGDLLLGRRATDGLLKIWLRRSTGVEEMVTNGPKDVTPAFAGDGSAWAYADYAHKSIQLCRMGERCQVLTVDPDLPGLPTFSHDGRLLSYVTEFGKSQMRIVDRDGRPLAAWDAVPICAGIWAPEGRIWSVESVLGVYYWAEHNALTGDPTGRRVRFLNGVAKNAATIDCRAENPGPGGVLLPRLQVEADEQSEIRVAPRELVAMRPNGL